MRDALMQANAATDQSASTTETAATGQEASLDPTAVHPSAKEGPIPFQVHKTALDNARVKEREAVQAEFDQQYGWAKHVPRETIEHWSGIAKTMASDPARFLDTYFAEAANDPRFSASVRSWAARTLGARAPQSPQQAQMPQPDVQIVDQAGNVTGMTYSDKQLALRDNWTKQQLLAEVQKEYGPLKAEREQEKSQRAAAEYHRQVEAKVDDLLGDVSAVLDIRDDMPAEQKKVLFDAVDALMANDPRLSVHKAAMQVRQSHVLPTLKASATRDALDTMKQKAAGNTAGSGGSATPLTRPKTAKELAAYMRSLG